ncbi:unnamed protein product, partial [Meganyctiphanes norvegica]
MVYQHSHINSMNTILHKRSATTVAEDLSTLSLCNASVMTLGSFGWWAGFLSGGPVVYTLYTNYSVPPFAHTVNLGPVGYDNFIGLDINGSLVEKSYYDDTECVDVVRGHDSKIYYPMCFNKNKRKTINQIKN